MEVLNFVRAVLSLLKDEIFHSLTNLTSLGWFAIVAVLILSLLPFFLVEKLRKLVKSLLDNFRFRKLKRKLMNWTKERDLDKLKDQFYQNNRNKAFVKFSPLLFLVVVCQYFPKELQQPKSAAMFLGILTLLASQDLLLSVTARLLVSAVCIVIAFSPYIAELSGNNLFSTPPILPDSVIYWLHLNNSLHPSQVSQLFFITASCAIFSAICILLLITAVKGFQMGRLRLISRLKGWVRALLLLNAKRRRTHKHQLLFNS